MHEPWILHGLRTGSYAHGNLGQSVARHIRGCHYTPTDDARHRISKPTRALEYANTGGHLANNVQTYLGNGAIDAGGSAIRDGSAKNSGNATLILPQKVADTITGKLGTKQLC